jgi:tyrosine-protein phosphatase YwqE
MRKQGIEVLLAHAERYSSSDIEQLLHVGAFVQINAETLASLFPPKHVLKWIDAGQVVAIGSDMHKRDKKAYKCFSKVAEKYIKPGSTFAEFSEKIWK